MKTKIYSLLVLCAGLLFSGHVNAQCGMRYVDSLFSYSVSTVTYDSYDSLMDIYQPIGDTASKRPVMILAHGGTFISGNKSDDLAVTTLCQNFAQRGYVTVSINYRLITLAQLLTDQGTGDTAAIITEVIQSLSDGKAAVRYMSKDAATANLYRIDTTKIFIGGNSAGAVMAMHYGYIDSLQQTTAQLQGIINANGGLEGNSGNAGYNSKVAAVVSLAGGLNNPAWVQTGGIPSFNAQGTSDVTVPYYCMDAENNQIGVRLCGLGSLQPYYDSAHITESSLLFPGQPHVPWETNPAMMYSVDSAATAFFVNAHLVTPVQYCPFSTGINNVTAEASISLFPNPATDVINLHSSLPVTGITICDETGRQVRFIGSLNTANYQINTTDLSRGVYFVKLETANSTAPVVKRIVLE